MIANKLHEPAIRVQLEQTATDAIDVAAIDCRSIREHQPAWLTEVEPIYN